MDISPGFTNNCYFTIIFFIIKIKLMQNLEFFLQVWGIFNFLIVTKDIVSNE